LKEDKRKKQDKEKEFEGKRDATIEI